MSKPVYESKEMCPLMRSKRELVCHKCAFYVHVRGKHPQSDEEVDIWDCSIALQPMLMLENSRQQHINANAIMSLRNEFATGNNRRIASDLLRTQALIKTSMAK